MRRLRVPFVMTVSTLSAAAVACGGTAVIDPSGAGGNASSSSTSSSSASNSSASNSSSSGAGGNGSDCPPTVPTAATPCSLVKSKSCSYIVACQSGDVSLSFTCSKDDPWQVVAGILCSYPHDSCPGTELYCSGQWSLPQGTNPPAPCPATIPAAGGMCQSFGFGGVWDKCGYPCDGSDVASGWKVATCGGDPGQWQHGPCEVP